MPVDLPNSKEEILQDVSQKENTPNTLPESGKDKINNDTSENTYPPEKVKAISNPIKTLLDKNLDAKKIMTDELCKMGLSVQEILRILRF